MKIIVDSHIPYIKDLLEPWAQVVYVAGNEITPQVVRDAQVLVVRTRTRCDKALLEGSSVEMVGTATIGTDHIDLDYCNSHGIAVCNAPGCNAPAVAQWVHASIAQWMRAQGIAHPHELTLGVVGVGHVGGIVARWAASLGFGVVLNDPPRGLNDCVDNCDIITYHTPLSRDGKWRTWHLCDEAQLARASRLRLVLNAARGGVCDERALVAWRGDVAIDCWEGEPVISQQLLDKAIVATPHIAGYSIEGKQRGTAMIVDAINRRYGFTAPVNMPAAPARGAEVVSQQSILSSYNPNMDTAALRASTHAHIAATFETLRNHYPLRHELQPRKGNENFLH